MKLQILTLFLTILQQTLSKKFIVTTTSESTITDRTTFPNVREHIKIGDVNTFFIENPRETKKELEQLPGVQEVIEDNDKAVSIQPYSEIFITNQKAEMYQWGLDRINKCCLPLSGKNPTFTYTGKGVDIYVIDTGVRSTHQEFIKNRVKQGYNSIKKNTNTDDDNGHGTHVSSTAIGVNLGVAKDAHVIPVKVLDSSGSGSWSNVIKGVEWVIKQHTLSKRCSIISMSLGGSKYATLNKIVDQAYKKGIFISVAAGNGNTNSCNYSPASASKAFTVGSTTDKDGRSPFSNYGKCMDVFAPGSSILGAWYKTNTDTRILSGTSMACPHVSGTAALVMEEIGCSNLEAVSKKIKDLAQPQQLKGVPQGTVNLLLQVPKNNNPTPKPTPTPRPTRISCFDRCRKRKNPIECLDYEKCGCSWVNKKCTKVCEPV